MSSTLLVVMFINEAESLNHVLGTIALVAKIASGVQTELGSCVRIFLRKEGMVLGRYAVQEHWPFGWYGWEGAKDLYGF